MNKVSTSLASLILLLAISPMSQAQDQSAIETAEAECVIKAKQNNIPEDQYVDYVGACMEKIIANLQ